MVFSVSMAVLVTFYQGLPVKCFQTSFHATKSFLTAPGGNAGIHGFSQMFEDNYVLKDQQNKRWNSCKGVYGLQFVSARMYNYIIDKRL